MFESIRNRLKAGPSRKLVALLVLAGATAVVAHAAGRTTNVPLDPIGPVAPVTPVVSAAPRIEAVFVLDTTGSMSGLIEGAKQKIWTLANEMANAQNNPQIRMGLIAYRDRGDDYVTRHFDLSPDVDALYAQLTQLSAGGGGDGPESVNQALHEAVEHMSWTHDSGVYRVVFLVGDAPPHMDYDQDVPYTQSVAAATKRGIVVNTIQCGGDPGTASVWKQIAGLSQGQYAAIAQDGAMVAMATPVDDELARLNAELAATALVWGDEPARRELREKVDASVAAPAAAAVSRLSYMRKAGGGLASGRSDLVDELKDGKVTLEEIAEAELPTELQGLDRDAQQAVIEAKQKKREEVQTRIDELVGERDRYVAEERARRNAEGAADSFDDNVIGAVHSQAAKQGIVY